MSNYKAGLKTLLREGLWEPDVYGDFVNWKIAADF